jgi:hypothetical protein
LRALVLAPETTVRCHLKTRGREPSAASMLRIGRNLPEQGVERYYCGQYKGMVGSGDKPPEL